jgi:hypothetical protein
VRGGDVGEREGASQRMWEECVGQGQEGRKLLVMIDGFRNLSSDSMSATSSDVRVHSSI